MNQLKAIMKGEEQERSRLARELHDGIGGMIAVIKMNVGSAMKENPEASEKVDLPMLDKLLENTSDEVRKTAANLMPDVLAKYGLEEAATLYCHQINNRSALFIDVQFHGDLSFLDKATELILYRIIQELIQNTIKHARATKAALQVIRHEDTLHLSLEDNGSGFDPSVHSSGFGLGNLRFRVQSLHGKLEIRSSPDQPTTVHIEFNIAKIIKYSNNG